MKTIKIENSVSKFIAGKRKSILEYRRIGLSYGEIYDKLKLNECEIEYADGKKAKLSKKAFTAQCSRMFKKCTLKEYITLNEKKIVDLLREGHWPSVIYDILGIEKKTFTDKEAVDRRCWKDRLRNYSKQNAQIKEIHDTVVEEEKENIAVDEAVKELKSRILELEKEKNLLQDNLDNQKKKASEAQKKIIGLESVKEELEARLKESNESAETYRKQSNEYKGIISQRDFEISRLKNRNLFQRILNK